MTRQQGVVLVVEDDDDLREAVVLTLRMEGYVVEAAAGGEQALSLLEQHSVTLMVSDVRMMPMDGITLLRKVRERDPKLPVILMTAYGDIAQAVDAMRLGACDFVQKPFEPRLLNDLVARFQRPVDVEEGPVAEDARTREVLVMAERVAQTDATVLLTGESGVGKEVVARTVHRRSGRAAQPFVAINCAAIPENLLEATLFGYEKGAFTGASQAQPGKFEQANDGTLLLDEISEMSLPLQAKLLRVLQEREVERVGGRKPIALDIRVLATSNRDLQAMVAEGRFREDLYYRLAVFPIVVPPLRERQGDIVPLARMLLNRHAERFGRPACAFTPEAEATLRAYPWPGNVRELENVVQRALVMATGGHIDAAALGMSQMMGGAMGTGVTDGAIPAKAAATTGNTVRDQERELILRTLSEAGGSRKKAAERLGLPERTLRYKLARWREEGLIGDEV